MGIFRSRAGLVLGVVGALCAQNSQALDVRSAQSLLESGLFLSQAEAEAALARLDADRSGLKRPVPNALVYFEQGAASLGQGERAGRIGYGGSASQMRLGVDREIRTGVVVGAVAGAGVGSVESGDMEAGTLSAHGDLYLRATTGRGFAKASLGVSQFTFDQIAMGDADARCRGQTRATTFRAAGQVGATVEVQTVRVTPTATLTLHETSLAGFDVKGDNGGLSFASRRAAATIGSVRLTGSRAVMLAPGRKVDLQVFVGVDKLAAFAASRLRAAANRASIATRRFGAPTGRGVVGGLGLGTAIAEGVNLNVNYDYSARDGVSTRAARAKLGVSF